jgi:hypothetical protein
MQISLHGFQADDYWTFQMETELRDVDGVQRWFAEINLFSVSISNALRVSEVQLTASSASNWVLRNAEVGDVTFGGMADVHQLPNLPKFNTNWRCFSATAAGAISAPMLTLRFKISC